MVAHSETWGPNTGPLEQFNQFVQIEQIVQFWQIGKFDKLSLFGGGLFLVLVCSWWSACSGGSSGLFQKAQGV